MGIFKAKSPGLNVFSSFKGTDHSQRLRNTFDEVQTFKRQLLKAEAALHTFAKATDELLKTTDDSLSAFPRVWRKADDEGAAPHAAALHADDATKSPPTTKKLGSYPSQQFIVSLETGLDSEVYTPIARWHKQYQTIKTRIASVEHARVEYDSARKDVAAAREAILKHARKTDGREDPALVAQEAHAETMLAAKRDAYVNLEAAVHTELVHLAADAQDALGLVARALQLESAALASAGEALKARESELPVINRESSGPLALGTGSSIAGSPAGTPTSASPTGYGASFKSSQPFGDSQPASPNSPEAVAAAAKEYRSPGSSLGDSGRMGRFDEAAAYEAEKAGAAPAATAASTASAPAAAAPAEEPHGVGALHLGEGAPGEQAAKQGVQDSAADFGPPAPKHKIEADKAPAEDAPQPQRTGIIASIFGSGAPPQPAS